MMTPDLREAGVIGRIAEVAAAVGWRAAVPAQDVAGLIVSFLAANPEHIGRFMDEGVELIVDGTIRPEAGCMTYTAQSGDLLSPTHLRTIKGLQQ